MTPTDFNHALESAFFMTLQTSLYATVLIALVFAVQFCFRKVLAPRWRYALSLLVLLRLALPVVPQSSLSLFNLFQHATRPDRPLVIDDFPTVAAAIPDSPIVEGGALAVPPIEPQIESSTSPR